MHPADLRAGTQLPAGLGVATVLPDIDFETYSEAGCVFDFEAQKWVGPPGAAKGKKGLFVVGAALYATHGKDAIWGRWPNSRGDRRETARMWATSEARPCWPDGTPCPWPADES